MASTRSWLKAHHYCQKRREISWDLVHHYSDVIIGAMTSQITSLTIVYSTVYSGADQRKLQLSVSLAFVWGIHWWPVNSPHKGTVTRKMFPFDDVIMSVTSFSRVDSLWNLERSMAMNESDIQRVIYHFSHARAMFCAIDYDVISGAQTEPVFFISAFVGSLLNKMIYIIPGYEIVGFACVWSCVHDHTCWSC